MNTVVVVVFAVVYVGMFFGELPKLQLDRTGVALLGAIALVATGALEFHDAVAAIDLPTIVLLFALMVVSAQLRLAGFYSWAAARSASMDLSPAALLGIVIVLVAALSAVFSNDVVCLAVPPIMIHACGHRRIDPIPFLLAVACAANVGSAATLIGNPQNMFIGQTMRLSFHRYLAVAGPIAVVGLVATWGIIALQYRGRWVREAGSGEPLEPAPPFDRWQTTKGLAVAAVLFVLFLATPWPREIVALAGAGVVLLSRRMHSQRTLGLVDWQLLVLFVGLFVVNRAAELAGIPDRIAGGSGLDLHDPVWLFVAAAVGSNVVSNVPAVILLSTFAHGVVAGEVLALASTLAGNLLIVGSIANMIVASAAERHGLELDWWTHAKTGVPVTLATLGIAAAGLWIHAVLV